MAKDIDHEENVQGTEICILVYRQGVTVYANREAFQSLAKWMQRNANSPKNEYYECNVFWDLMTNAATLGNERPNIWVLFDKHTYPAFKRDRKGKSDFELKFMTVEKGDLDKMRKYLRTERYPEHLTPKRKQIPC